MKTCLWLLLLAGWLLLPQAHAQEVEVDTIVLSDAATYPRTSIPAGPNVTITASGQVVFEAEAFVADQPTFSVHQGSTLRSVGGSSGAFCDTVTDVPAADCEALVALYEATDGTNWTTNTGWLTDTSVGNWHGVLLSEGRVGTVDLRENSLQGAIPSEIGNLTRLNALFVDGNSGLTGPIPITIINLPLRWFHFGFTGLCEPDDMAFKDWIRFVNELQRNGGIQCSDGESGFSCATVNDVVPTDCEALVALYNATDGTTWGDNTYWLNGVTVGNWQGVSVEAGRVISIALGALDGFQLSGEIPPEIGALTSLTRLYIVGNQLTGEIPAEIGNLTNLTSLTFEANQLSGEIPAEIGNLTNLTQLDFKQNQLSGEIPSEIGNLVNLTSLHLNRTGLSGTLPQSLVNLSLLNTFRYDETNLCAPANAAFQNWLQTISTLTTTNCTSVATDTPDALPAAFTLQPNYPNPFNPSTVIRYTLPHTATVNLAVYDVLGSRVAQLVEAEKAAGRYEVAFDASKLPSGMYIYRLEAAGFHGVGRMLLVR